MVSRCCVFDSVPSCSAPGPVPVGGGEAEEPDSSPADQTVHRTPTSSRPLLSDGAQLPTQDRTEEGKDFSSVLVF